LSTNWVKDINDMHNHFLFHDIINYYEKEQKFDLLKEYLKFRIRFLEEELNELKTASTAEDIVDALIDLCVVAIGTLDLYKVNAEQAWNEVLRANMSKKVGIKENRPNAFGFPDLIKPEGWIGPSHENNHGLIGLLDKIN